MSFRRTRIVCTLGPASSSPKILRQLIAAGMDIARFNFSHGDHAWHRELAAAVREAATSEGRHVALLQDVQGPKIRTGLLENGPVVLRHGETVTLTSRAPTGGPGLIPISHPELIATLRPHDRVVLADGQVELRVRSAGPHEAVCAVARGGVLGEHKGVAVPGRAIPVTGLTDKDVADIRLGAELRFDYLALSFVRGPADITTCRQLLDSLQWNVPVVAKIEQRQAVRALPSILPLCGGVMVARGDLGVELSLGEVPAVQKDVIDRANSTGVPVITATEMLESMVTSHRPTRAEASDVANAIWDGTDAVMLSQETSVGANPVEAVRAMAKLCIAAESHPSYRRAYRAWREADSTASAIAHAAKEVAGEVGASAIVAFTESGATALRVSKTRPGIPILACSPKADVLRRCSLFSGVIPISVPPATNTDDMVAKGKEAALRSRMIRSGQRIVVVSGVPIGIPGQTNLLKVETV